MHVSMEDHPPHSRCQRPATARSGPLWEPLDRPRRVILRSPFSRSMNTGVSSCDRPRPLAITHSRCNARSLILSDHHTQSRYADEMCFSPAC